MKTLYRPHLAIWIFIGVITMTTTNDAEASWFVKDTFNGMTVEQAFTDKRTAAMVDAVSHGRFKEADKQLAAGADVNAVGKDGLSPLLWVMHTADDDMGKMEYLLKAGANPNYRAEGHGISAMSWVAEREDTKPLLLLLRYKGNPNLLGPKGKTLLYMAASWFLKDTIDVLLKHGADINAHDSQGYTAGNVVAWGGGHFELVEYLLKRGLSYNLQGLAKSVDGSIEAIGDEAQKAKVIEMLKARGAKFPAFNPNDPRDPEPWNCDKTQNRNVRCDKYAKKP